MIHSDLSGKEWIPSETLGRGRPGYYLDVPRRLYINTRRWGIIVGARSQKWSPRTGYTNKWRYITIHPDPISTCDTYYCGRLEGHRGECRNWRDEDRRKM